MRRYSLLLALAASVVLVVIAIALQRGYQARAHARATPTPKILPQYDLSANAWRYNKDDPQTNRPVVRLVAQAIHATHDPSTFELEAVTLRLYNHAGDKYTFVSSASALFDDRSGLMKSSGPVHIVMDVPAGKEAADPIVARQYVRVDTTALNYETKSGKAETPEPAVFAFPDGGGKAKGVEYDPSTRVLHLKSEIALDWVGRGSEASKMHVETTDLVYKELEQKIYMQPGARLVREHTTLQASNVVVTLDQGRLHQIDGDRASGGSDKDGRQTLYSADRMQALFNENGTLVNLLGFGNTRVESSQPENRTVLTGDHADLRFAVSTTIKGPNESEDSLLHLVMTDGHAAAESTPVATTANAATLPDTRLLRSEHIELEMQPDGRNLKEIRTSSEAEVEFKPNRPALPRRVINASHIRVIYGADSYVDRFLAWNAQTTTYKVALAAGPTAPKPPTRTWSDQLTATFESKTNQIATVDQTGHFRYEEGIRKASADRATFQHAANRMTLTGAAHISDTNGTTLADCIITDQTSGDMDATGHVVSTHAADPHQKPGTSMLDDSEAMQAKADHMVMTAGNTDIRYQGHALIWQGANRTMGDTIHIDRDRQTLEATGNVTSELVDQKNSHPSNTASAQPIFTIVYAPELTYSDVNRTALYRGGVKLTRNKMIITAKELTAYLVPKQEPSQPEASLPKASPANGSADQSPKNTAVPAPVNNNDGSSLDRAVAQGSVDIFDVIGPNHTRVGSGERGEYFTSSGLVTLDGGAPRVVDSIKGTTSGSKLTYYSDDDHLIVDGLGKQVFTEMKKKFKGAPAVANTSLQR